MLDLRPRPMLEVYLHTVCYDYTMAGKKGRSGKYPKSPEHRAKLAGAARRQWAERKAKGLPAANLGVTFDREARANMSRARLGNTNARTHGMAGTRVHNSWRDMKSRCSNPNAPNWKYYGGRGVSYDPRWETFEGFYADMGDRPAGATLDRIDPEGDYTPENCRWATPRQQRANQRPRGGDAQ